MAGTELKPNLFFGKDFGTAQFRLMELPKAVFHDISVGSK